MTNSDDAIVENTEPPTTPDSSVIPEVPPPTEEEISVPSLPRLSVLWFAFTLFWGVILSQVLQQRVEHFVGDQKGSYIAIIGPVGAIIATLVQLVIGPLSDHFSHPRGRRHPFVLWGIVLSIIPILTFATSQSFFQLLVSFALIQLFLNSAIGPFQAVIPDRVPVSLHGKASGWMGLWQLLGQIVGVILPGLMLTPFIVNWVTGRHLPDPAAKSYGVLLGLGLCCVILILCLVINGPLLIQPSLPSSSRLSWKKVFREAFNINLKGHPDFVWLLASRFVINIGISSVTEFLLYYIQEVFQPKNPSIYAMYIALAATCGGVPGTLIAGRIADRTSKRQIVYWSCAFASIAGIGFCLTHSFFAALILGFIFGIGYGAFCAVDWAFAANLIPKHQEAKFMAIFHIAFTVPQTISFLFGIIGQHFSYRAIYAMVPLYLLLGSVLITKVRERHEIEGAEKS